MKMKFRGISCNSIIIYLTALGCWSLGITSSPAQDAMLQMPNPPACPSTPYSSCSLLCFILLGVLLGTSGQIARSAVGLKKEMDLARRKKAKWDDWFDMQELLVSLLLGAAAGAFAAIMLLAVRTPRGNQPRSGGELGLQIIQSSFQRRTGLQRASVVQIRLHERPVRCHQQTGRHRHFYEGRGRCHECDFVRSAASQCLPASGSHDARGAENRKNTAGCFLFRPCHGHQSGAQDRFHFVCLRGRQNHQGRGQRHNKPAQHHRQPLHQHQRFCVCRESGCRGA
jgi:hypothetical protein